MKALMLAMSLFASGPCFNTAILGTWKYVGFIYENEYHQPTDPKLDLRLMLSEDRSAILKWSSSDEQGFCERKAWFEISDDGWLYQKVTWVNPENKPSCSRDQDMQLGSESYTHYRIEVGNPDTLFLDLELDGKPLVYILTRIPTKSGGDL